MKPSSPRDLIIPVKDAPSGLAPCPFCANTKFQRNTKAKGYHEKHRLQRAGKPSSNHLIRCTRCGAKGPLQMSMVRGVGKT